MVFASIPPKSQVLTHIITPASSSGVSCWAGTANTLLMPRMGSTSAIERPAADSYEAKASALWNHLSASGWECRGFLLLCPFSGTSANSGACIQTQHVVSSPTSTRGSCCRILWN